MRNEKAFRNQMRKHSRKQTLAATCLPNRSVTIHIHKRQLPIFSSFPQSRTSSSSLLPNTIYNHYERRKNPFSSIPHHSAIFSPTLVSLNKLPIFSTEHKDKRHHPDVLIIPPIQNVLFLTPHPM